MWKLSTKFHFLSKKSTKSMSKPIRKLSNVDLLSLIFFDDIHSMLNLWIQVIDDSILLMNFSNLFDRNVDGFNQHSRTWVKSVLEVTFIIEGDHLFVELWELLVDSVTIIESLSPLSDIMLGDTPSIKEIVFELTFIDDLILLIHFSISIEFRVDKISLINELILKGIYLRMTINERERRCWWLFNLRLMGFDKILFIGDCYVLVLWLFSCRW